MYIPKATTIKIVTPLVTFFSFAKIQIIYLFANSIPRAGWVLRSVGRGGGGEGVVIRFYKTASVLTDEDHYILS